MNIVKAAHEDVFNGIDELIFALASQYPMGHPVRRELYKCRCVLGDAKMFNRLKKDYPQLRWEFYTNEEIEALAKEGQI